jgi:hypothetical protein
VQSGAIQRVLANPNIRWQENTEANFGLDMNFLADRLAITARLLHARVRRHPRARAAPAQPGRVPGAVRERRGDQQPRLRARRHLPRDRSPGFELNTSANVTTTRNKVLNSA